MNATDLTPIMDDVVLVPKTAFVTDFALPLWRIHWILIRENERGFLQLCPGGIKGKPHGPEALMRSVTAQRT